MTTPYLRRWEARPHEVHATPRPRHPRRALRATRRTRSAGYTSAQKIPGPLGGDHLRLLLGRLRHVRRRQGRPGRERARQSGSSGERGMLCPKGLSEHHTARRRPTARTHPLLRVNGTARAACRGTRPSTTMATAFRAMQAQHGAGVGRRDQHRPAGDRRVLRPRQARAARASARATTAATPRSAWRRPCPATSGRSAATALRAPTRTSNAPTSSC